MDAATQIEMLGRYFSWSQLLRAQFDGIRPKFNPVRKWSERERTKATVYISHWYASLWVVVEAWKRLGLHDADVDAALASSNVNALHRYHRGVFQFDIEFIDNPEPMALDGEMILWARFLADALALFFLEAAIFTLVPKAGTERVM